MGRVLYSDGSSALPEISAEGPGALRLRPPDISCSPNLRLSRVGDLRSCLQASSCHETQPRLHGLWRISHSIMRHSLIGPSSPRGASSAWARTIRLRHARRCLWCNYLYRWCRLRPRRLCRGRSRVGRFSPSNRSCTAAKCAESITKIDAISITSSAGTPMCVALVPAQCKNYKTIRRRERLVIRILLWFLVGLSGMF